MNVRDPETVSTPAQAVPAEPSCSLLGTTALLFEAPGTAMTLETQQLIWSLAELTQEWPEILESVPGMNNLMLVFRQPPPRHLQILQDRLMQAWRQLKPRLKEGRIIELPVVYGGEGGPHMADVMAHTGLSLDEVVARHVAPADGDRQHARPDGASCAAEDDAMKRRQAAPS